MLPFETPRKRCHSSVKKRDSGSSKRKRVEKSSSPSKRTGDRLSSDEEIPIRASKSRKTASLRFQTQDVIHISSSEDERVLRKPTKYLGLIEVSSDEDISPKKLIPPVKFKDEGDVCVILSSEDEDEDDMHDPAMSESSAQVHMHDVLPTLTQLPLFLPSPPLGDTEDLFSYDEFLSEYPASPQLSGLTPMMFEDLPVSTLEATSSPTTSPQTFFDALSAVEATHSENQTSTMSSSPLSKGSIIQQNVERC